MLAVHVSGFDASLVGVDELREHFEGVGPVDSVKIVDRRERPGLGSRRIPADGPGSDRAFVNYLNEDAAARAVAELNDFPLCTLSQAVYTLRVTWSAPRHPPKCSGGGSSSSTPAVDSASLKLFVSWKTDFEWTWEDLRTFLGRHGGVKSIMLGPRTLNKRESPPAKRRFANVWLTDVDAELTSIVQASVDQNHAAQALERDGWTLYVQQFTQPRQASKFEWNLSPPAAAAERAPRRPPPDAVAKAVATVGSAAAALGALSVGAPLLQPPDALDDKSPTVLMASLLGQPEHSGTALVTKIVAAAYGHPELGENARSVVKSAGGGKKFFLSRPTVFTVGDPLGRPGNETVTLTDRGWSYVRAITKVTPPRSGATAAASSAAAAQRAEPARSSASRASSRASTASTAASPLATWSALDVSAFCKTLGLSDEVCQAFVDNLVDGKMLAVITDKELIDEIGMKPLWIKRLRRELEALRGGE